MAKDKALSKIDERYVDIQEQELNEYLDRLAKEYGNRKGSLNEEYWGVSPFDWIRGLSLKGIFAPLKWLALLAAGGLGLLIVGLLKALKEGKKQIAIARVRQWIKGLVVVADGGYKKQRRTKDSLFLIQARARRDILQAAVMSGYAAGLDIPVNDSEPADKESAKNESLVVTMDSFLNENEEAVKYNPNEELVWVAPSEYLPKGGFIKAQSLVGDLDNPENGMENFQSSFINGTFLDPETKQKFGISGKESHGKLENVIEKVCAGSKNHKDDAKRILYNITNSLNQQQTTIQQQAATPQSIEQEMADRDTIKQKLNASYNLADVLPDDSQVDWSLLKTIKTSKWFGLVTHKTDLWAEAKSVYVMDLADIKTETDRQKYLRNLISNVNAALVKLTTPSIARNYTNVINQFVQSMMQRSQKDSEQMMRQDRAADTGKLSVGNHGNTYESERRYAMFSDDIKVFEAGVPGGGQQAAANQQSMDYPSVMMPSYGVGMDGFLGNYRNAVDIFNRMNKESEIDYDRTRPLIDNAFKAMQAIFTANPVSDYLVFRKTSEQMANFLNELTKSVHTVIESVAKKAKESGQFNGNSAPERMVLGILSDSGDPRQNRSLKNLWDNIARPQLDSRAITRCFALTQSPEFSYLLDILTVSIPICVMMTFMPSSGDQKDVQVIKLLKQDGTNMSASDVIKKASQDEQARQQYQNINNVPTLAVNDEVSKKLEELEDFKYYDYDDLMRLSDDKTLNTKTGWLANRVADYLEAFGEVTVIEVQQNTKPAGSSVAGEGEQQPTTKRWFIKVGNNKYISLDKIAEMVGVDEPFIEV